MEDFYILIGLIFISICVAAVLIKILSIIDKHADNIKRFDGELQLFSDENKDTYRFVIYKDIDSIPNHKTIKFKVVDVRDKNTDNNENYRKEDIL